MKVRFLADADLNKAILSGVLRREPSVDFLAAQAAGLRKMKDPEVLALQRGRGGCLFHTMSGPCLLTFANSLQMESTAPAYFLFPKPWNCAQR